MRASIPSSLYRSEKTTEPNGTLTGALNNHDDGGNQLYGATFYDEHMDVYMVKCILDNCDEHFPPWAAMMTVAFASKTQLLGAAKITDGHVGWTDISLTFENGVTITGPLKDKLELKVDKLKGTGYWKKH
jgi:hypothetical protein